VDPAGGNGFDIADGVGDAGFAGEGSEDVDVIGDAAGGEQFGFAMGEGAADIFIKGGVGFRG